MQYAIESILLNIDAVLLALARISGMFFMSPVFGRRNVPAIFTIGLILALTFIVAAYYPVFGEVADIGSYLELAFYIIKEIFIGLIMGYVVLMTFSAFLLAGQLIDSQIGFGVVHILDPQTNIQIPLVGNFNNVLAMVFFFAMDGHHTLIKLLLYSFEALPLGKASISADIVHPLLEMFVEFFVLGFKMAVPAIAAALLAEVVFGVLVRVIPQMNVLVVGLPFKILIGLVVLSLAIPVLIGLMNDAFSSMFKGIRSVVQGLNLR